ncbi:MAG: hypothetical protein Q8M39_07380, partial [Sulfuricurvum sp.]|nr:hypothetical protein [Sulfuricurvum sp.]
NVFEKVSNRLTCLVFNDRKLKLNALTQGVSSFVEENYREIYLSCQEVFEGIYEKVKINRNMFSM